MTTTRTREPERPYLFLVDADFNGWAPAWWLTATVSIKEEEIYWPLTRNASVNMVYISGILGSIDLTEQGDIPLGSTICQSRHDFKNYDFMIIIQEKK